MLACTLLTDFQHTLPSVYSIHALEAQWGGQEWWWALAFLQILPIEIDIEPRTPLYAVSPAGHLLVKRELHHSEEWYTFPDANLR